MAFFNQNSNGPKITLRERFATFMEGRYGIDEMYRGLFVAYLVLIVLSLFVQIPILGFLSFFLVGYMFFRMLSRDIEKRRAENVKYLTLRDSARRKARLLIKRVKEIRTHTYKACPKCKATLRLPRQKGDHAVRCPKCGERFEVKIRL